YPVVGWCSDSGANTSGDCFALLPNKLAHLLPYAFSVGWLSGRKPPGGSRRRRDHRGNVDEMVGQGVCADCGNLPRSIAYTWISPRCQHSSFQLFGILAGLPWCCISDRLCTAAPFRSD